MSKESHSLCPGNCRWSTPLGLFSQLDDEFNFDLDVCAEEWNAKCKNYISPIKDGLSVPWFGVCWMNPPYGRVIKDWIRKAYEESRRGVTVVSLVPARTETGWWHDYCLKAEIRFIRGRVNFINNNGKSGRPRFGSAVVVFRPPHHHNGEGK
ncbi:adenine methyltransferase [Candidatus Pacearchaeota archaeon]|nr:adenine methyltransferase [Candidatus Pacearchaeota archaeon]